MRSELIPNRISISDRYPMLGFTIRVHGGPALAEVTLATDPALFGKAEGRSSDNFFSTRSMGPLQVSDGEAVYIVPAEVLARFVGKKRLYFALATAAGPDGPWTVEVMPDADSVYISLEGLTGRSLRRVRMFPDRAGTRSPGYGANGDALLHWSGDKAATPGTTPSREPAATPAPRDAESKAPAPAPYNDGFGDLPPLPDEQPTGPAAAAPEEEIESEGEDDSETGDETEAEEAAIAASLGVTQPAVRDVEIGDRRRGTAPETSSMGSAMRLVLEGMMITNPALAGFMPAIRLANAQGLSVGIGIAGAAGFAAGGSLGAGVIFAPNNALGIYGAGELDLGAIFSASVTVQMTILRGGISAFRGITWVAGFSAGEGIVGGGVAIFDQRSNFVGVSVEIGLGVGSPLDVYAGVQRGVAQQLGYATAFGAEPAFAEPMLRDSAALASRDVPRWRSLIRWSPPAAIRSEMSRRGFSIQTIGAARGDLSIDMYEVRIDRLPSGTSSTALIRHIRENLARFVDSRNTEFNPYSPADGSKWRSSSPTGTVFNLDIAGPDNAAVVASLVTPTKWRFTTIETPDTGSHPVSGHREFGIRETDNGKFIVYTKGADRFTYTSAGGALETAAFAAANQLWESFQEKVAAYVNANGGVASVLRPFRRHFEWGAASRALSTAEALGVNADPYTVEVKYRMFIPSPAISGAPIVGDFGGDNRSFSYSSGTSRGEIVARVKLTPGMGIERVNVVRRAWGESKAYDRDDTHAVSGKPDWWLGLNSGARPTRRETLRATSDNLNVVTGTSGRFAIQAYLENASVVSVRAAGALPLMPMSPDIDVDMGVFFRKRGGQIQVKAVGRHDGFPCHEMYVNGRRIYSYDPVRAGKGPSSLVGWGDVEANGNWVDVAATSGGAQALGINESFTINWDDVQQIAQPTSMSCWAAAAAMVVGWRDKMSLSPTTLAEIVNRPIQKGLNVNDFDDLAEGLGLTAVAGQSFTPEGFRDLLEENGPLWVGVALPGSLHAIVVTGMYNDENGNLMVRISDPWDRIVGAPGTPGSYQTTHTTGSRYIMTWEAFEAEYAEMGASTSATFQILHAGGTHGHTLNRGGATPPGYAAGLGIDESFSINWDEVQMLPQPTNASCWAAAAAMLVGWREHQSLSPRTMAEIAGRPIAQGLDPDDVGDLARALGLTAEQPMSYLPSAFRDLVERKGPLWVGVALPNSLHAVVVTGMYTDENGDLMIRVTDPWDRIVGRPGSPGAHRATHRTGSRYIMTWEAFEAQYARMGAATSGSAFQILHTNGTHGHRLNRGTATPPPGYAAGMSEAEAAPAPANGGAPAAMQPSNGGAPRAPQAVTISREANPIASVKVIPASGPNGVPTEQRWMTTATEVLGAEMARLLADVPALAAERQWSVAVSVDGPSGFGAPGVGIGPGGTIFRYGVAPAAKPASQKTSPRLMVTVAEGAPETFGQWTRAQAFSTGSGVTGAVLLNEGGLPLGLAMRLRPTPDIVAEASDVADAVSEAFTPPPATAPGVPEAAAPAPTAPDQTAAASALAAALAQMANGRPPAQAVAPGPNGGNGAVPGTSPGPAGAPAVATPPPAAMPVPGPEHDGDFPPPGVSVHRSDVTRNGVHYALFLMDGVVMPEMPPAVQAPMVPGQQIVLDDWPYLDGPSGRTKGGVVVDWSYGGGAVGNVRTAPASPAALDGWTVTVNTDVGPGPDDDTEAKLKVTVRTQFTKEGETPRTGACFVTLSGSGKHEVEHKDESPATVDAAVMA